jgi:hypothetical protein
MRCAGARWPSRSFASAVWLSGHRCCAQRAETIYRADSRSKISDLFIRSRAARTSNRLTSAISF